MRRVTDAAPQRPMRGLPGAVAAFLRGDAGGENDYGGCGCGVAADKSILTVLPAAKG